MFRRVRHRRPPELWNFGACDHTCPEPNRSQSLLQDSSLPESRASHPLRAMSSPQIPVRSVVLNGNPAPVPLSALGLGLMSLSVFLGGFGDAGHQTEETALAVIGRALDAVPAGGKLLVNTATFYGTGHNEWLLGKAIARFGRERFFITDKFGQLRDRDTGRSLGFDISRASIREQLAGTLERLGTDRVDCYLPARIPPDVPIEETAAALKELVEEGKIGYAGLSEANAETIRRASKVCPIAFLETEYSMFSLHIRESILPACRELGVKVLAYSPLGRGMLTAAVPAELPATDMRRHFPRFQGDNLSHNLALVAKVQQLAAKVGCTPAQLAIAWLMADGEDVFPIPGTKSVARLEENLGAAAVRLPADVKAEIDAVLAGFETKGDRYPAEGMGLITWQERADRARVEEEARRKRENL
ncbi:pyridoxine 4-dehydrogenase [Hyaloraphidium curvatum]|nr:pyridoxine 4-dehydrogenase [Hyaloraphidium curvatum]